MSHDIEICEIDIDEWLDSPITKAMKNYLKVLIQETLEDALYLNINDLPAIITNLKLREQIKSIHELQEFLDSREAVKEVVDLYKQKGKKCQQKQ